MSKNYMNESFNLNRSFQARMAKTGKASSKNTRRFMRN